MQMISFFLNKGLDLEKLTNLKATKKHFYIASMLYEKEQIMKIISDLMSSMFGGG